ncbi:MAG: pantoate--beta-alanine ligase [Flavobacteriaceae bacterium]|tara:strand:- start:705 stop:1631 length:927 start_codon:yes stop_codon:yes gene_type:complete
MAKIQNFMQIKCNSLSLQPITVCSMKVFTTNQSLRSWLNSKNKHFSSLGFVPTMGALHQGHLSLIKRAVNENENVVVSIFVNPTQFNNAADLETYPRDLKHDLKLIESLGFLGKIIVYAPGESAVYGNSVAKEAFDFGGLELQMEGKFRPGHFQAVGTVVQRLLNIVGPTHAYFGEKDFQQLQIVRKLVKITKANIKIVACPIQRDSSGLAMSSRNTRLTSTERHHASKIYKALKATKNKFSDTPFDEITQWVTDQFEKDDLINLEYFQISDQLTLQPANKIEPQKKYRAFISAYIRNIRLIDNMAVN